MLNVFTFSNKFIKMLKGIQLTSNCIDNTLTTVAVNLTTLKNFDVITDFTIKLNIASVFITVNLPDSTVTYRLYKLNNGKLYLSKTIIK